MDEHSFDESDVDDSFADEELSEEVAEEVEEPTEEPLADEAEPERGEKAFAKPDQLPVTLAVELGRLRMTASRLLDLQPGNVVELSHGIESGVYLYANGACVGRGELVRIGDVVGVRVVEIG